MVAAIIHGLGLAEVAQVVSPVIGGVNLRDELEITLMHGAEHLGPGGRLSVFFSWVRTGWMWCHCGAEPAGSGRRRRRRLRLRRRFHILGITLRSGSANCM